MDHAACPSPAPRRAEDPAARPHAILAPRHPALHPLCPRSSSQPLSLRRTPHTAAASQGRQEGTGKLQAGAGGHCHRLLSRRGRGILILLLSQRRPPSPDPRHSSGWATPGQVEAILHLNPLLSLPIPCPHPPPTHLPAYSSQTQARTDINNGLFQVFSPLSPKKIFILSSIFHFFSITAVSHHLPTTLLFSHKHKSYYLFPFCVFAL